MGVSWGYRGGIMGYRGGIMGVPWGSIMGVSWGYTDSSRSTWYSLKVKR